MKSAWDLMNLPEDSQPSFAKPVEKPCLQVTELGRDTPTHTEHNKKTYLPGEVCSWCGSSDILESRWGIRVCRNCQQPIPGAEAIIWQ
jgi:hypothetical protein